MKTIIEPFKIKSVEPIKFTTIEQRIKILKKAKYNPFLIKADDVIIDLLTDSGTNAMSSFQWGGVMEGDESYAGSRSFFRFEKMVKKITGFKNIIPTHQGRAAEKILFSLIGGKGKHILSNTLFDTTRANIEFSGATGVDFLTKEGKDPAIEASFKGNIDLIAMRKYIEEKGAENIPLCLITITNNSGGGQPVSMQNIRDARAVCDEFGIKLYLDACRFAENAYFIKIREEGYANKSVLEIAQEMFSYADGATMSAKKDALANIGGFLATNNSNFAQQCRNLLIITEGFPTYGGLAGRDLEAIAIGLDEVLDENYLQYRIQSTKYVGDKLSKTGVPIIKPPGGHAIYLDAKTFLSHILPDQYPGLALCNALYLEGGIRCVEIGSVMFGKYAIDGSLISPEMELVRLAIPRRVYTQSHMDYVIEIIESVFKNRKNIKGYKIVYEPEYLRHFTAEFEEIGCK